MKRSVEILLGVLALAVGVAAAWYGRSHYLESVTLVALPVPAFDVPANTLLTAEMFTEHSFPRALAESGQYALQTTDLAGKISTVPLLAGMPVAARQVVAPEAYRLAPPDQEVVSIPIHAESALAGQLRPGELINVYLLKVMKMGTGVVDAANAMVDTANAMTEVRLVTQATVVGMYTQRGERRTTDVEQQPQVNADTTQAAQQQSPPAILLVSLSPDQTTTLLNALAEAQAFNGSLWVTLASLGE